MTVPNRSKASNKSTHTNGFVNGYLDEGKKFANDVYISGLEKVNLDEKDVQRYSKEFSKTIKTNPIKSVLIAGGVGFFLAKLFSRH
ncbi:MAG: hypothetical protein P1U74_00210 [Legionellaceae bacterium]|nr:hypothetical protein [Legionellaceae bacterium]